MNRVHLYHAPKWQIFLQIIFGLYLVIESLITLKNLSEESSPFISLIIVGLVFITLAFLWNKRKKYHLSWDDKNLIFWMRGEKAETIISLSEVAFIDHTPSRIVIKLKNGNRYYDEVNFTKIDYKELSKFPSF